MICKHGYFNRKKTTKTYANLDKDPIMSYEEQLKLAIDLSKDEEPKIINIEDKNRIKLIKKIKNIDKAFVR